jgi:hypothetical protein
LVNWLEEQQLQPSRTALAHGSDGPAPLPPAAYSIQSCKVLEVSAAAVDAFLQQQQELLLQTADDTIGQPLVLLHLGVDTQVASCELICTAVNIRGHQAKHQPAPNERVGCTTG